MIDRRRELRRVKPNANLAGMVPGQKLDPRAVSQLQARARAAFGDPGVFELWWATCAGELSGRSPQEAISLAPFDFAGVQNVIDQITGLRERLAGAFGSVESAERWWLIPAPELGWESPSSLSATETGRTALIENLSERERNPIEFVRHRAAFVFGDAGRALSWWTERHPTLGGKAPRELAGTPSGRDALENELARIESGDVF